MKRYDIPIYPTKDMVERDGSILEAIPKRWKGNAPISVLLSGLLVLPLSGCDYGRTMGMPEPKMNSLTEDEARLVIMEEALKAGINFDVTDKVLENIDMLFANSYNEVGEIEDSKASITLKLDGYDEEKKIAFEYITENDFYEWTNSAKEQGKLQYCGYNEEVVLKNLKAAANRNEENITVGTFYTPMYSDSVEASDKILRKQVREFIEWLKSEGII